MPAKSAHPVLHGRTALITGATAGIGYETARVLAERGAQVVITGRDADRGERATAAIRGASGNKRVSFMHADYTGRAAHLGRHATAEH